VHVVEAKGILSPTNGMNIYRGCSHGCIYCDARSTCYQMKHDFEDIEVKGNAPQLLEKALASRREKCMIATGAMSDPYLHLEEKFALTRQCLEIIHRRGFGLSIQTKSARILRDIDLLEAINRSAKCVVQMTLTTFDEALCRLLEPHVSSTRERFEVLMECKRRGIPTVVWITPLLPFINDTEENLRGILGYCLQAGVKGIICPDIGVTLREGDREYFYQQLDRHFPGLKARYAKTYGNSYFVVSPDNDRLMPIVDDFCRENDIISGMDEVFAYMREFPAAGEQISMFDL